MNLTQLVDGLGGLAATHELYDAGYTRETLALAVRQRRLMRVRQGWYALPGRDDAILRSARVGGRATCCTALDRMGVWVVDDGRLHVAVPMHACQLRRPRDRTRRLSGSPDAHATTAHWSSWFPDRSTSRLLVDPLRALADLARCTSEELIAASAESLLHEQPEWDSEWPSFVRAAPARLRPVLAAVDGTCESGTEFLFFWRMRRLIPLRRQVPLTGIGRVDFVIGERLVVEVDGLAYHVDPERFEADRRRDAQLSIRGKRVLRFSYEQVMERWPEVEGAVLAAVARGDHR